MAYRECGITMTAMAKELRLSVSRISRLIVAVEAVKGGVGEFEVGAPDKPARSKGCKSQTAKK